MRSRTRLCGVLLLALSSACGSKSALYEPEPADAGTTVLSDAAPPARPPRPAVDECIELPYRDPPHRLELAFLTQIMAADIFLLVDVTGSMREEIREIRTRLREEIVPALATEIPDARFSVGHFADFPLPDLNYGEPTDELFRVLTTSTDDLATVQAGVDLLPVQGGRDGPEALVQALYLTATGEGFERYASAASCPAGTVGAPCFGPTGSRIVLAFTDAPSHNGPRHHDPYVGVRPEPHRYEHAIDALNAIGAKVLGLYSGGASGQGQEDLLSLARDTGAVRADGQPIVFDIGRDGRVLAASVVEAIRTLVQEVPIDVDLVLEDHPGDSVDATQFVREVVAVSADPPSGAIVEGQRFAGVHPGTRVSFRLELANERIVQTDRQQDFLLRLVVRGDRVTRLMERVVQIVVPPRGGGIVCP